MRNFKITALILVLTVSVGAFIFAASSCSRGVEISMDQGPEGLDQNIDMVIARVGETEITLGDLLEVPQLYGLIDDRLINSEIILQEAVSRGIIIDMDEIQTQIDEMAMMSGGYDEWLGNMNPIMPRALILLDVHSFFELQAYQTAIAEDIYDTTIIAPDEVEIENEWTNNQNVWQNIYTNENEVEDSETITFEMAHDLIASSLRDTWITQNMQRLIEELRAEYTVEFYLRDAFVETSDIEIPLVTNEGEVDEEQGHGHNPEAGEEEADPLAGEPAGE